MDHNLQTRFSHRQYMLSKDFEIYYYNDFNLTNVQLHTHDYYEFYFFLEGKVSMRIWEKDHSLRFGDVMFIPPQTPHHLINHDPQAPYRRFVLWISQEYFEYLNSISPDFTYFMEYVNHKQTYIFHNDRISFNTIQSLILRLLEEIHGNHFGCEAQIPMDLNQLVLHINRLVYEQTHPKTEQEETSLYLNIKTYIEEHPEQDLSLDKLAEIFYVSKFHIAHLFKAQLGISIHQYITKKRLSLCRDALLANSKVADAFLPYGFKDYSNFYRAFKKEYGISPKEFQDAQTAKYNL